jgi:hypothetical protein
MTTPGQKKSMNSPIVLSLVLALLVAGIHASLAAINLTAAPTYDEMYTILAAESLREKGQPFILDGEYRRAEGYTWFVAQGAKVCGPSLECARSLSILASAALVFAVAMFSGVLIKPSVGFLSGLLLALNPIALTEASVARFYPLHALVFFLFAVIAYLVYVNWRNLTFLRVAALAILGGSLLLLASHLQVLTQIGVLAVVAASLILLVPSMFTWASRQSLLFLAFLGLGVILLAGLLYSFLDVNAMVSGLFRVPAWAEGTAAWYYYRRLQLAYPVLWALAPFLFLLALLRWPRISVFSITAFSVGFVVLSIAEFRGSRFLLFLLPFLVIPLAAGVLRAVQMLTDFLRTSLQLWLTEAKAGSSVPRAFAVVLTIGALLPYMLSQPLVVDAARMVAKGSSVGTLYSVDWRADWMRAAQELKPVIPDYPVVISSAGVKAAYYLGSFSFDLNLSVMRETDTRYEFGRDRRTGRQVISSPESLTAVLLECGRAVVLVEDVHLDNPAGVPVATVAFLDRLAERTRVAEGLWMWRVGYAELVQLSGSTSTPLKGLDCNPVTAVSAQSYR